MGELSTAVTWPRMPWSPLKSIDTRLRAIPRIKLASRTTTPVRLSLTPNDNDDSCSRDAEAMLSGLLVFGSVSDTAPARACRRARIRNATSSAMLDAATPALTPTDQRGVFTEKNPPASARSSESVVCTMIPLFDPICTLVATKRGFQSRHRKNVFSQFVRNRSG